MSTPSRRRQLMTVYGDKTERKPTRRDTQFLNPIIKPTRRDTQFLNPRTYRVKLASKKSLFKKKRTKKRKKTRKNKKRTRKTRKRKTRKRKTRKRKTRKRKTRKRKTKRKTRKRRHKVGGLTKEGKLRSEAMIASGMLKGSEDADEYRSAGIKFLQELTSEKQEEEKGLNFNNLPKKK